MSKFVERIKFSESINGLPININNEEKSIHFTPSDALDEIWAWVLAVSSSSETVTVKIANVDLEFTVNSENSPVLAVPGVTSSKYLKAFNPNANGSVNSIVPQPDGKILLGGSFTSVSGTTRNRIARVFENGDIDTTFDPNVDSSLSTVLSMAQQSDGKILLGGDFTSVSGTTKNRIARVFENGDLDATFNPNANGSVNSIVPQPDGKILLGGQFTSVSGTTKNRIARVFENGDLDTTFDPNVDSSLSTVLSIVRQSDGKILLGGFFTSVSGTTRNGIARFFENGDLDTTFNPNANGNVRSIVQQPDGKILLGGDFSVVSGIAKNFIARVFENGDLDTTFNPNASGQVRSIIQQSDGKILLGGQFTSVSATTRNRIARVGLDGNLLGGDIPKEVLKVATLGNVAVHGYVNRIE